MYESGSVNHSVLSNSFRPHQAPLSMEFTRQEYKSGLPFPSPGDLPDPGIKPVSPALAGRLFTTEPPGKPLSRPNFKAQKGNVSFEIHLL